jgi:hypothetical protein
MVPDSSNCNCAHEVGEILDGPLTKWGTQVGNLAPETNGLYIL